MQELDFLHASGYAIERIEWLELDNEIKGPYHLNSSFNLLYCLKYFGVHLHKIWWFFTVIIQSVEHWSISHDTVNKSNVLKWKYKKKNMSKLMLQELRNKYIHHHVNMYKKQKYKNYSEWISRRHTNIGSRSLN